MSDKVFDVVFVGAGPSTIAGVHYLHTKLPHSNFLVIEMGKNVTRRNHGCEFDCVNGIGGAGLFSDGKFSYFPAGTKVWELEHDKLKSSYEFLKSFMDKYKTIPEFPVSDEKFLSGTEWTQKRYETHYLSLEQRIELSKEISIEYYQEPNHKFMLNTEVINVVKRHGNYVLSWRNVMSWETGVVRAKKVVFAGGRFMPLFLGKLKIIPMTFKRIELGVRFEGPADSELYSVSENIDPKFMKDDIEKKIQYRTFCWCRDGEVVCTNCNGIKTWSGRSDCDSTKRSNFGFNVRFKDPSYMHLLKAALDTLPFVIDMEHMDAAVPDSYREIFEHIKTGLTSFLEFSDIKKMDGFKLIGPTIEGVGSYPDTDDDLKVPGEDIWITGDATGKFRGIIAAMLSGIFVAHQIVDLLEV